MAEGELGITVLKDRILIEKVANRDVGIISVVNDGDQQVLTANVVKIGDTVEDIEVGNTVMYERHSALPIKYQGTEYFIIRESDIIAIV